MTIQRAPLALIDGTHGVRIACRLLGDRARPPVVLTSGIGCGPVFMNRIAQELARDHFVIYWDYRGHGPSGASRPVRSYRIADHAADLERVVRVFASDVAPVMVAFSMGVQVAIEWTRIARTPAAGFVFMLGVPRNPMHRTVVLRRPAARLTRGLARTTKPLLPLLQGASKLVLRTPMTYLLARSLGVVRPNCPPQDFADFVRYATDVPLDAYLGCVAALLEHDATDAFLGIREPVLMLASEHDVFIDPKECRAFAARHAHARFELLRAAGHAGMVELGHEVAERVQRFMQAQRIGRVASRADVPDAAPSLEVIRRSA